MLLTPINLKNRECRTNYIKEIDMCIVNSLTGCDNHIRWTGSLLTNIKEKPGDYFLFCFQGKDTRTAAVGVITKLLDKQDARSWWDSSYSNRVILEIHPLFIDDKFASINMSKVIELTGYKPNYILRSVTYIAKKVDLTSHIEPFTLETAPKEICVAILDDEDDAENDNPENNNPDNDDPDDVEEYNSSKYGESCAFYIVGIREQPGLFKIGIADADFTLDKLQHGNPMTLYMHFFLECAYCDRVLSHIKQTHKPKRDNWYELLPTDINCIIKLATQDM